MAEAPLPLENWRSRWLHLKDGVSMHRVAAIWWEEPDEGIRGPGRTVCGAEGFLHMPGIFSRMSARRCPLCCDALGIPRGYGAPFNALQGEAQHA